MKSFSSAGFIGGGRATRFLLEGWKHAGRMPQDIKVADGNPDVLNALKREFPDIVTATVTEAGDCEFVVLSVHPPVMKEVLPNLKPLLKPDVVVLSLAPKITVAAMTAALGTDRIVRMIPNAPSAIGRGYNPVAYGRGVDAETKAALAALFAPWGEAPEVPEKDLEAYAMVSAMGPTYMWFQWQTLRELAAGFGLDPQAADRALLRMIEGAAECLLASGRKPADVMNMIPVRPLQEDEPAIVAAYCAKLSALYEKIRPR